MVLRHQFDLTRETTPAPGTAPPGTGASGNGPVRLGEVLDWNLLPCGELTLPQASLNRHAGLRSDRRGQALAVYAPKGMGMWDYLDRVESAMEVASALPRTCSPLP